ncbi:uncharacterized protein METZ01_LOCUS444486 [marine metagenome]|uniref:Uncharacterized protein n=1 Tax=marine metagenome TaxID=408172 RepID=A0A382Z810_9ZZZZ
MHLQFPQDKLCKVIPFFTCSTPDQALLIHIIELLPGRITFGYLVRTLNKAEHRQNKPHSEGSFNAAVAALLNQQYKTMASAARRHRGGPSPEEYSGDFQSS